jgi:hypothetical protein
LVCDEFFQLAENIVDHFDSKFEGGGGELDDLLFFSQGGPDVSNFSDKALEFLKDFLGEL